MEANKEQQENEWWQNKEVLTMLKERATDYKSGKATAIPWEIAKKEILASLQKKPD
jgi:hypothetical protein